MKLPIPKLLFVFGMLGLGSLATPPIRVQAIAQSVGEGPVVIDGKQLANRRFQFSWSSTEGGGVNGIATLKADGSIEGIHSPNESTWRIDDAGRLLFVHADGRVSTRYAEMWREDGLLMFEGPFLFRQGITHHLLELEGPVAERVCQITPEQASNIQYSTQQFIYLDLDESHLVSLGDGSQKQLRLVSVHESEDRVIHLARRAVVQLEIDGKPFELVCGPYVMPTEIDGLRIQVDTTSAWLRLPKHVQLSVWDASQPVVDTNRFCFPLPDYRLFSHGMQAYNEPVHLGHRDGDPDGQCFHHNYGVDFAGYEGRQKVVSCIDGVVEHVDSQQGDLFIRDDKGFVLYYGHLDAILSEIRPGAKVSRGQWVAMLGKRGASGNFSHLHVGACLSRTAMSAGQLNRNLNLYPWLIAAYQETWKGLCAIARPHRTVLTGDRVLFDASNSLSFGAEITSCRWEFHDGTKAVGRQVEKVYEHPGCYMTTLRVTDSRGRQDIDFCKVKVFSREKPESVIPTLFVTRIPARTLRVDEPVSFRIWPQGLPAENIRVDFGDGTRMRDYRPYSAISHTFRTAGSYIMTVSGSAGNLPISQKVHLIVQAATHLPDTNNDALSGQSLPRSRRSRFVRGCCTELVH
jgi:hypothetical protein